MKNIHRPVASVMSVTSVSTEPRPPIDLPVPVSSLSPVDIPPMNTVIYFREVADGSSSPWRLCDVQYMSETWVIVRALESVDTEELVFEFGEIEFATWTPAEELDEQIYAHMHSLFINYSVRCLFEAGWRLVKEEGDSGIPF